MSGLVMSSTPIAVRLRCPPERPLITALPMNVSAHFSKPRDPRSSEMSSLRSSRGPVFRSTAENFRASLGVAVANISSFCITYAIRWRTARGSMRCPAAQTEPVIEMPCFCPPLWRPAKTLSNVVFPEPLGPRMQVRWPDFAAPFTFLRILRCFCWRPLKCTVIESCCQRSSWVSCPNDENRERPWHHSSWTASVRAAMKALVGTTFGEPAAPE
mmetsp:Transcript_72432/g.200865  ORF Transcript_72432/g.200865 Transcript_72432/m.200865 type:complete len:214 (+) Transcript_72432:1396-2037(+)